MHHIIPFIVCLDPCPTSKNMDQIRDNLKLQRIASSLTWEFDVNLVGRDTQQDTLLV